MIAQTKSLAELNQEAIRLLYRELGVVNAVRFLRQFTTGFGSYVEERETLFADKTMKQIIQEINQRRGEQGSA